MISKTGIRWWIYDQLTRITWLRRLHDFLRPYATAKAVFGVAIATGILSWIFNQPAAVMLRFLASVEVVISGFFVLWDYAVRWTDSQVGTSTRNEDFVELLCKPLPFTEARPVNTAQAQEEVALAARLEHEAFSVYGSTPEDLRAERIRKWFHNCSKSIYFMLRGGTVIGYSVIIPVSELDAQRYREGLLKEFGFVPDQSAGPPTTFYAQALFLKRELQNRSECRGLAQRVFFQHIASFFPDGRYQPFGILADSETWDGARFLRNLGFKQGDKSADGRPIYELDLRQPGQLNDYGRVFQHVFGKIVAAKHSATGSA